MLELGEKFKHLLELPCLLFWPLLIDCEANKQENLAYWPINFCKEEFAYRVNPVIVGLF